MRFHWIESLMGAVLLAGLAGCTSTQREPESPASTETPAKREAKTAAADAPAAPSQEPPAAPQEQQAPAHSCAEKQQFEGRLTMKGELHSTKGGQIMLQGAIIKMPAPAGMEGADRHKVAGYWFGKTVEIVGDRCVYYCEPGAQCLSTGSIPSLRDVEVITVDGEPFESTAP